MKEIFFSGEGSFEILGGYFYLYVGSYFLKKYMWKNF